MFAESGYAAPLSAVARRAGVGQGSLYRHFPDRIALATAVFEDNLGELEDVAGSPEATLDDLLDLAAQQASVGAAFFDLVSTHRHDPRVAALGDRVRRVVVALLERDRANTRVSPAVTAEDVELALFMIASALARSEAGERHAVSARARALFQAAFRP